jgi:predicted metalloprotease with PDZ domain
MRRILWLPLVLLAAPVFAQSPIAYHVTFPEPEHHYLQVEATFADLGTAPLKAFISRSSPGRYAVHEFAKNVFWFEAYNGKGQKLAAVRPNPYEWDVAAHDGTVRIVYKVYGDLVDGTYLAVDTSHAHMNMPATFMFGLGLENRPMRVTFTPPPGRSWKVGTQLYPTNDPWTFTAPNLQYFMDSPTELSDFVMSGFSLPNADGRPANFRIVAHTDASQADVDDLAKMVERLAREEMAVFGEFPPYEPGAYTFLLDYWSWDGGDGMEHRNSTFISDAGDGPLKTPQGRQGALNSISHEFFHNWNVERIRPAGLEPFDFTRANVTCCLWLAEGFTQYYGPLLLTRAGFGRGGLPANPNAVINGAGRAVRSAVQMSEYAPFSDAARSVDPTDASRTFISYYTYGAVLALGLDLSLRETSNSRTTLDDFMKLLWQRHGKPAAPQPGLVAKPYDLKDLRDLLAELTANRAFADQFFDKYVEGRDVLDYAKLLEPAGFQLRPSAPDRGWLGNLRVQVAGQSLGRGGRGRGGVPAATPAPDAGAQPIVIVDVVPIGTPAYNAGLDQGDTITAIDGQPASPAAWSAIGSRKPGETITLAVTRRDGSPATLKVVLSADPAVQAVDLGTSMTPAQKAFREAWLGTRVK